MSVVVPVAEVDETAGAFTRPLREDPATLEVIHAPRGAGAAAARGDVVLFVDGGVLPCSGLATAHARRHASGRRQLVLGYTQVRVLHERAPGDFGARLQADQYESQRQRYERDPARVLAELWGGAFSLRREDCIAIGMGEGASAASYGDRALGLRCREAGIAGVFDPSLRAIRVYEPSLSAFVRDARADGDPHTHDERPRDAALSLALRALVLASGSAHVWRMQDRAARALWQLERRRGAPGSASGAR